MYQRLQGFAKQQDAEDGRDGELEARVVDEEGVIS
jgi:hypothetical protein